MARIQKDILSGDDMDILIQDGNLVFGDATQSHQERILLFHKGELKFSPLRGVGAANWLLEDDDMLSLKVEIQDQFEADGMTVKKIDTMSVPMKVEATYE